MQQPGGSPLVVREIVHVATPQNPVSNQAFNFQQLPAPKGAGGLADHSGVATGNPVPSYLPLQEQWEISTEAGNLEPLPEARPANYPTWSPERQ